MHWVAFTWQNDWFELPLLTNNKVITGYWNKSTETSKEKRVRFSLWQCQTIYIFNYPEKLNKNKTMIYSPYSLGLTPKGYHPSRSPLSYLNDVYERMRKSFVAIISPESVELSRWGDYAVVRKVTKSHRLKILLYNIILKYKKNIYFSFG